MYVFAYGPQRPYHMPLHLSAVREGLTPALLFKTFCNFFPLNVFYLQLVASVNGKPTDTETNYAV